MVLEEDVAVVGFAKVGKDVEFAFGDGLTELRSGAVVLDDLDPVEPMFAVSAADDDAGGVPGTLLAGPVTVTDLPDYGTCCTLAIAKKIVAAAEPTWMRIGAYWYPRGGIPIDVFWQTGAPPEGLWLPDQGVEPYRGR